MRTFVAIPLPDYIKQYAAQFKNELNSLSPDVKWVEYGNYHLTLKFLGEINLQMIGEIREKLLLVGESCPVLQLWVEGLGFFPNGRRPKVIWLGIKGEMDKAFFLGERVDTYLSTLGFEAERKRSYHFTLGRIRSNQNLDEFLRKCATIQNKIKSESFTVNEFHLMESQLSPNGPRYIVHDTFKLKG